AQHARRLIDEVEALGGMTVAIERGVAQQYVERAAVERQVRAERGVDRVIGVNLHQLEQEREPEIRRVDNRRVLDVQRRRLAELRASRDACKVADSLNQLEAVARSGAGNLLQASIDCMAARATLGEVSRVLVASWGRHRDRSTRVMGVFDAGYADDQRWQAV